jgi:hypothetical protein
MALKLATWGSRKAPGLEQYYGMGSDVVFLGHGPSNRADHFVDIIRGHGRISWRSL